MNTTAPKPFVFVLMPFDDEFDDIYKLGIKPTCEKAGAYAERVDEQIFTESILERIYNQIAKADVIISDMTGKNPNVFYETGYAHALGKTVILLTKTVDDIPFDLRHYKHIVHGGKITNLLPQLEAAVTWALQQPSTVPITKHNLQFYIEGQLISGSTIPVIKSVIIEGQTGNYVTLKLDAHNPEDTTSHIEYFKLGLRLPPDLVAASKSGETFDLPDSGQLLFIDHRVDLVPGEWKSFRFNVRRKDGSTLNSGDHLLTYIRTFFDEGVAEHKFEFVLEDV